MQISEIIKTAQDEGKEKHVPHLEIDIGCKSGHDIVRVVVGHEVEHPNTTEHHIAWVELYGLKKDSGPVINLGRGVCTPVYSNPNFRFQINKIEEFKSFYALAYCNIHGLWANSLER